MKKLTLLFLVLFSSIFSYAQSDSLSRLKVNKNEIKFNIFYSIIGKLEIPEISYERLLEDQASVGISLAGRNRAYEIDYMITPHLRYYFPKTHQTFFLELSVAYLRSKHELGHDFHGGAYEGVPREKMMNNGAIGGAIGLKYLFSKYFSMDMYVGLGRIVNEDKRDSYRPMFAYPRIGIALGPRF